MKTVSEKQLAANRANAARSTGPRTPEGKARAALNSRKHSLTAAAVTMLRLEDQGELENLRADALAHYQPQTSQEIFAVERIAVCQLMMVRGWRLEAGMFIACVDRVLNDDGTSIFRLHADLYPEREVHVAQNRNYAMAEGFQRMATQSPMWSLVLRYQAQVERQYRRAVEDFQRLVRERKSDSPNEPVSGAQPQETEAQTAPADEPVHEPDGGAAPAPPTGVHPSRDSGRHDAPSPTASRARRRTCANTFRRPPGQPKPPVSRLLDRPFYVDFYPGSDRVAAAPAIIPLNSSKRISYA
jgi:hypothetical protein